MEQKEIATDIITVLLGGEPVVRSAEKCNNDNTGRHPYEVTDAMPREAIACGLQFLSWGGWHAERGKSVQGIMELNLHGKNQYQAKVAIEAALRRSSGVYRIRLIHGYHRGTQLRDMIGTEYAAHPKVLRIETGANLGQTDLVLRELLPE